MPLTSICIPTLNRPKFLSCALESVLAQTFQDFEIIVLDNKSDTSDENSIIIEKLNQKDKIKYFFSDQRVPMWQNWNNCLAQSSGKYTKFLMDDDVLHPQCLEIFQGIFTKNKHLVLASSARREFSSFANLLEIGYFTRKHNSDFENTFSSMSSIQNYYLMYFDLRPFGTPSQVMFDREVVVNNSLAFDARFSEWCDIGMWTDILQFGEGAICTLELCAERKHQSQAGRIMDTHHYLNCFLEVKKSIAAHLKSVETKLPNPDSVVDTIAFLNVLLGLKELNFKKSISFLNYLVNKNSLSSFLFNFPNYIAESAQVIERRKNRGNPQYIKKWLDKIGC